ncbi:MAG TPA: hypothetical protein DCL54_15870 [Alphaproteobacteria bacterium]|nr:hypothetical protein [Alphaproteobacteria bacterium]HAJ48051.1 hypothetical protein [Alphaproteobacteria bacterium]
MLGRVASYNQSTVLLAEYQRIQSRTAQAQEQISSGKVGTTYADVEGKAGVLAAAKAHVLETEAYAAAAREVEARMSFQDVQLVQMGALAAEFREALGNAVASNRAEGLMETARGLYAQAATILNTRVDGVYIYGGTRSDTPPVNAATLDELLAAPIVADVFDNSTLAPTQSVDAQVTLESGVLASDVATGFFQMLRDLAVFDTGANGPFTQNLTQSQAAFLNGQFTAASAVARDLDTQAAEQGVRIQLLQDVIARHDDRQVELNKFVSSIEDVDVAEAITRLNHDQAAQQAAARMIAQLQEFTLLNVLN